MLVANPMNLKLKILADVTPPVQICISFSYTDPKNHHAHPKSKAIVSTEMLRKKPKNKELESFPPTLAGFGYYVKPDGSIRSIQSGTLQALIVFAIYNKGTTFIFNNSCHPTDTPYDFEYKLKDRSYNEARYEAFTSMFYFVASRCILLCSDFLLLLTRNNR